MYALYMYLFNINCIFEIILNNHVSSVYFVVLFTHIQNKLKLNIIDNHEIPLNIKKNTEKNMKRSNNWGNGHTELFLPSILLTNILVFPSPLRYVEHEQTQNANANQRIILKHIHVVQLSPKSTCGVTPGWQEKQQPLFWFSKKLQPQLLRRKR